LFNERKKLSIIGITLAVVVLSIGITFAAFSFKTASKKKQATLTAILDDQGDPPRAMKMWFQPALEQLRARHPDIDIKLDYRPIPYLSLHTQLLKAMTNQTRVDLITGYDLAR
jgi:hypothetical protein